jgi:hypothetical protein
VYQETERFLRVWYRVKNPGMARTAGEVRFVKDHSGDANQWAYALHPPTERDVESSDFEWKAKNMKPLAKCMRAVNAALGHTMSGYTVFAKIKSAQMSPDGRLGGRGYIQKIADMRRSFMNIVEALSALSDTMYDELQAPYWARAQRGADPAVKEEIEDIVEHTEEIRKDPEGWAEEEIAEDEAQKV